jgi:hypothetical protein
MNLEVARRLFEWLRHATGDQVRHFVSKMTVADLVALDSWFELWAHESQLEPPGDGWRVWLMMAGRVFGKTRAGAEWINGLANARFVRSAGAVALFRAGTWEIGAVRGSSVIIADQQVVGSRLAAITSPSGGTTVDSQARTAIGAILTALRTHGLIES